MDEVVVDTSPLQYLHQLGQLALIKERFSRVVAPPAVVEELSAGRARSCDLPDLAYHSWIEICQAVAPRV
ncbi:MAG: DUF3368 domain-containing protein, partial [Thermoanaerobaculia bacterium]